MELILNRRNQKWQNNPDIPTWVDLSTVGLDQFFTKDHIARYCHNSLLKIMKDHGEDPSTFNFVEPSAGAGVFFDLLPKARRIGIDIAPMRKDFIQQDFLDWEPSPSKRNTVVVGNPPFGYRAWLALAFVNRAAKFSDYVGMILPMAFQSDGKGSPKHRVRGLRLVHSEVLPADSFHDPDGKTVKVNGLWQVWKKGEKTVELKKTCSSWIDLFTVDQRKERLCGHEKMHLADYFIQRTFYRDPPDLVKDFSLVKYVCGYGMIFKKEKRRVQEVLRTVDWKSYSNLAAHNCRHISMYHIERALTDAGFVDA
jgi:hypothetical protein